jgi:isopentenyl phosphate kinase
MLQDFFGGGQTVRLNLVPVRFDIGAHRSASLEDAGPPVSFGDTGEKECIAEDANIGIAVSGDAIEVEFATRERPQRVSKREEVDCVLAVEQSAINVEKVSVEPVPGTGQTSARS